MAASGLHATTSTQLVCPLHVCLGVCKQTMCKTKRCFGCQSLVHAHAQSLSTRRKLHDPRREQQHAPNPTHTPPPSPLACVARSQKRTVVSPLPLARRRPSGLKLTDSTASASTKRAEISVKSMVMEGFICMVSISCNTACQAATARSRPGPQAQPPRPPCPGRLPPRGPPA